MMQRNWNEIQNKGELDIISEYAETGQKYTEGYVGECLIGLYCNVFESQRKF